MSESGVDFPVYDRLDAICSAIHDVDTTVGRIEHHLIAIERLLEKLVQDAQDRGLGL